MGPNWPEANWTHRALWGPRPIGTTGPNRATLGRRPRGPYWSSGAYRPLAAGSRAKAPGGAAIASRSIAAPYGALALLGEVPIARRSLRSKLKDKRRSTTKNIDNAKLKIGLIFAPIIV